MRRSANYSGLAAALVLAGLTAGCIGAVAGSGSFEKVLTVTGPVRLELQNGSGTAHVTIGATGEVRIHGNFRVRALPWENAEQRVAETSKNPPIEQHQNLIRVGADLFQLRNLDVDYTIVVPADTEVRAQCGSGKVQVRGIRGAATLTAGSGEVIAEQIGEDTHATAGSGDIQLSDVKGDALVNAGSGDLRLSRVKGEIRAGTGSGDIAVEQPGGAVTARTGSGDVRVSGASADLRIHTSSGDITIEGNPGSNAYWELRTRSGRVTLTVPPDAHFRFYAHSHSGQIETALPIAIEERSKRELRGRLGEGGGRVEVQTGSGNIQVR